MKEGFYWYRGSGKEPFDPDEGWVIVSVEQWKEYMDIYFTGSEISHGTELEGKFIGPIQEPK